MDSAYERKVSRFLVLHSVFSMQLIKHPNWKQMNWTGVLIFQSLQWWKKSLQNSAFIIKSSLLFSPMTCRFLYERIENFIANNTIVPYFAYVVLILIWCLLVLANYLLFALVANQTVSVLLTCASYPVPNVWIRQLVFISILMVDLSSIIDQ